MQSKGDFFAFFAISTLFDMYFVGFFVHFVDNFADERDFFAVFVPASGFQIPRSFSAFPVVVFATSSRGISSSSARNRAVSAV